MNVEKAVRISAQLYDCRNAAMFVLGDKYQATTEQWRTSIEKVAEAKGVSHLKAATMLGAAAEKEGAPVVSIVILAAYVEMVEPSRKPS